MKYYFRIRIERCHECGKLIINKGMSLHYDIYHDQINCTYCKKCERNINHEE